MKISGSLSEQDNLLLCNIRVEENEHPASMVMIHFFRRRIAAKATLCFFLLMMVACTSRKNAEGEEEKEVQAIPSVCIWDRITVRQEPFRNSEAVSNLNLGESVTYLGVSAADSTYKNQLYHHIRLSDERMAWVPAFSIVTDAKPAVVIQETPVYLRPDLLTITDRTLEAMDIVAVVEKSDDWISFCSEKKIQSGWIHSEALSYHVEDIAFSLYAIRILNTDPDRMLTDKIDSILKNNLYPHSVFVPLLKEIGEKEKERIQIEEIVRQNFMQSNH